MANTDPNTLSLSMTNTVIAFNDASDGIRKAAAEVNKLKNMIPNNLVQKLEQINDFLPGLANTMEQLNRIINQFPENFTEQLAQFNHLAQIPMNLPVQLDQVDTAFRRVPADVTQQLDTLRQELIRARNNITTTAFQIYMDL